MATEVLTEVDDAVVIEAETLLAWGGSALEVQKVRAAALRSTAKGEKTRWQPRR